MSEVILEINGQNHRGWTEIQIQKSLEHISGAFELVLTDRWQQTKDPISIKAGDPCRVSIDNQPIINGYIDLVEFSYDKETHEIRVRGRDKTGDLVDCSIAHGTGEWKNLKLEDLVKQLVQPFNISVKIEVNTGENIKKFNVEQGMTVFEAIQKVCALRGCLAISDNEGNLVITRSGNKQASTHLIEGENILRARATYDHTERFQEYIVKGQQKNEDNIDAKTAATPKSQVTDSEIKRYRPMILVVDGETDQGKTQTRAEWETSVRKGKSRSYEVTIQGWQDRNQKLWELNQNIKLKSAMLGVDEALLIAGTNLRLGSEGEIAELTLTPPEAFELNA